MDETDDSYPHVPDISTLSDLDSFEVATSPGYYTAARRRKQEQDESQVEPATPGLNRQILSSEIPEVDSATPRMHRPTPNTPESPRTPIRTNQQLDLINEQLDEIRELIVFDTIATVPLENLKKWMDGLSEMGHDPSNAPLALELLMNLKFQIKQKKLGKPFTEPFNRDEFLRGCVRVGRQAMASSPFSPQTQLQIKLEKQKRMLAKEDAMYMEPDKFYQKMPKPKEGFFVYGACFGKPPY